MTETDEIPLKKSRMILISIILMSILLFIILSGAISSIVLGTYQSFELQDMHDRMDRFSDIVNFSKLSLSRTADDYAVWDGTADYIIGKNPDYLEKDISSDSFIKLDVNIIGFFDRKGNPLFIRDYSNTTGDGYLADPGLEIYLSQDSPLIHTENRSALLEEVIFNTGTKSGILISRPVEYHTIRQPTGGTLVMGRYFNNTLMDELSIMTENPIHLHPYTESGGIFSGEPDVQG
jgi:sensor domain CHASE-containing protein